MTKLDKKFYEGRARADEKRKLAASKAANRGVASVEWHKHNKLTPETFPDFKKAMREADKMWDEENSQQP